MRVLLAGLVLALSACATQQPTRWIKAGGGGNQVELDNHLGECTAQGFSVAGGTIERALIVRNQCMFGKGWRII